MILEVFLKVIPVQTELRFLCVAVQLCVRKRQKDIYLNKKQAHITGFSLNINCHVACYMLQHNVVCNIKMTSVNMHNAHLIFYEFIFI